MLRNKKILITGGNGFIGSNLIRRLKIKNRIYSLDLKNKKNKKGLGRVRFIEQDLSKDFEMEKLPEKIDIVIHLAMDPLKEEEFEKTKAGLKVNILSTLYILEYAKKAGAKTFLYTSTGSIHGYKEAPSKEGEGFNATDLYSVSKYCSELLVKRYSKFFTPIIVRFFYPYGPGQKEDFLIPRLIKRISDGEKITTNTKESPKLNPIFITDVVEMIGRILFVNKETTLNIGGEGSYSIYDICEIIGKILNKKVGYHFDKNRNIMNILGDIEKAKKLLNYKPKIDLEEGIGRLILQKKNKIDCRKIN